MLLLLLLLLLLPLLPRRGSVHVGRMLHKALLLERLALELVCITVLPPPLLLPLLLLVVAGVRCRHHSQRLAFGRQR